MLCVEIMKGKLTVSEINRASREITEPHTPAQISEIAEYIATERPELVSEIQGEYWYKKSLTTL